MKKMIIETPGNVKTCGIYLWEEWCDDRPSHLLLSLQLNLDQDWTATVKKHGNVCQHCQAARLPLQHHDEVFITANDAADRTHTHLLMLSFSATSYDSSMLG